jgi:hypothetical protein
MSLTAVKLEVEDTGIGRAPVRSTTTALGLQTDLSHHGMRDAREYDAKVSQSDGGLTEAPVPVCRLPRDYTK